jgi:hypothetical protein
MTHLIHDWLVVLVCDTSKFLWIKKVNNMTPMTIEQQKELAKEVLEKVRIMDPYACVLGGAPRDWFMGNPAQDIDIYIKCPHNMKHYEIRERERRYTKLLGYSVNQKKSVGEPAKKGEFKPKPKSNGFDIETDDMEYHSMPCLKDVFGVRYKGLSMDLIFVGGQDLFTETAYEEFDSSICKIGWRDKDDVFRTDYDFSVTIKTKEIRYYNKVKPTSKHVVKLLKRFPDFKHVLEDGTVIHTP